MSAFTRYLVNTAQAKTGLGISVIAGYLLQAAFGLITAALFLVAVFFVFADYFAFGGTATSVGMFLGFAALLAGSMFYTSSAKRRTKEQAERALSVRAAPILLLNPPLLKASLQMGHQIGWRRLLPAAVVALAATGVAAEWTRRHHTNGRAD
jgi:uncharacterized membrane protein YbhN (UPF0104 family)